MSSYEVEFLWYMAGLDTQDVDVHMHVLNKKKMSHSIHHNLVNRTHR